jgi:hypothetical protein
VLDWEVAIPETYPAPTVLVAELLDGWLVSLFFLDRREFDGFEFLASPWQQVVHIDADGKATVVGERRNLRDHQVTLGGKSAFPLASWWVSPPLYMLAHAPDVLDTGVTQPSPVYFLPRVPLFYGLALVLMLASVGAGYFWLRNTKVNKSRRGLWLASCAVLGAPAFLSMICLEPRTPNCG